MTQLDKLENRIRKALEECNIWKPPFKLGPDLEDGRDQARGAYDALMYVCGQIRSVRRESKK